VFEKRPFFRENLLENFYPKFVEFPSQSKGKFQIIQENGKSPFKGEK
jgi:hypothetical protein